MVRVWVSSTCAGGVWVFERACMVACVMFVWMCNVYLSCGRVLTFGHCLASLFQGMSHALRCPLIPVVYVHVRGVHLGGVGFKHNTFAALE